MPKFNFGEMDGANVRIVFLAARARLFRTEKKKENCSRLKSRALNKESGKWHLPEMNFVILSLGLGGYKHCRRGG